MNRRAREASGPADAMNFIAAICKVLYRHATRNKVAAFLVMAATATVVTVCAFTFGGTKETYGHELRGLREDIKGVANSLHSLQVQVSALGSHEQKQGAELTYWLSSKDVRLIQQHTILPHAHTLHACIWIGSKATLFWCRNQRCVMSFKCLKGLVTKEATLPRTGTFCGPLNTPSPHCVTNCFI